MEGVPTKLLGAATLTKDVSEQHTLTGSVLAFSGNDCPQNFGQIVSIRI